MRLPQRHQIISSDSSHDTFIRLPGFYAYVYVINGKIFDEMMYVYKQETVKQQESQKRGLLISHLHVKLICP